MVQKFQTSLALQSISTAIFANSPFIEGKESGYLSLELLSGLTLTQNRRA